MELVTFLDAKNSRLREVSQSCPDSVQFQSLVNKATRMLMTRGSFWGTVVRVKVCTYNGCITWPRFVGSVLATSVCRHSIPISNQWYDFLPMSHEDFLNNGSFQFMDGQCRGNLNTVMDGMTPVFNPIQCGFPQFIQVFPSVQADLGQQITLFGLDINNQPVRSRNAMNIWQDGEVVTLAAPWVQTVNQFSVLTRITKAVTQGIVRYYQFNPTTGLLNDLVWHQPNETTPMYRHSRIHGMKPGQSCPRMVDALVKLEFVPVAADTDLVLIPNLDALESMIMAIKEKENGNIGKAQAYEADAVHELNLEMRNRFPNSQVPAQVQCFGTARLERQNIGGLF